MQTVFHGNPSLKLRIEDDAAAESSSFLNVANKIKNGKKKQEELWLLCVEVRKKWWYNRSK